MLADPVLAPKHSTLTLEPTEAVGAEFEVPTVADATVEQPLASVTVTVYVPAASPLAVAEVPPEGDQL